MRRAGDRGGARRASCSRRSGRSAWWCSVGIAGAAMLSVFSSARRARTSSCSPSRSRPRRSSCAPAAPLRRRLVPVAARRRAAVVVVAALPDAALGADLPARVRQPTLAADSVATSTLGQLDAPARAICRWPACGCRRTRLPVRRRAGTDLTRADRWCWRSRWSRVAVVRCDAASPPLPLLDLRRRHAPSPRAARVAVRGREAARARVARVRVHGAVRRAVVRAAGAARAGAGRRGGGGAGACWLGRLRLPRRARRARRPPAGARGRRRPRAARSEWILLDEVRGVRQVLRPRRAALNVGVRGDHPRQARPFGGGYHLDLDQLDQTTCRASARSSRGAAPTPAGRPPTTGAATRTAGTSAWRSVPGVTVRAHLPLQGRSTAGGSAAARRCAGWRRQRAGGDRLVAAPCPRRASSRSSGRPTGPSAGRRSAAPRAWSSRATPGEVEKRLPLRGGAYDVWVRASTGRRLIVSVDGRVVGRAKGLNPDGQWLPAGSSQLAPGSHGRARAARRRPGARRRRSGASSARWRSCGASRGGLGGCGRRARGALRQALGLDRGGRRDERP